MTSSKCRLCLYEYQNEKESKHNITNTKKGKEIRSRLINLGIELEENELLSSTICRKCYNNVSKIENRMRENSATISLWQSNQSNHYTTSKRSHQEGAEEDESRKRLRESSPEKDVC